MRCSNVTVIWHYHVGILSVNRVTVKFGNLWINMPRLFADNFFDCCIISCTRVSKLMQTYNVTLLQQQLYLQHGSSNRNSLKELRNCYSMYCIMVATCTWKPLNWNQFFFYSLEMSLKVKSDIGRMKIVSKISLLKFQTIVDKTAQNLSGILFVAGPYIIVVALRMQYGLT